MAGLDAMSRRYGERPGVGFARDLELDPLVTRWFVLIMSYAALDAASMNISAGVALAKSQNQMLVPTLNIADLPK